MASIRSFIEWVNLIPLNFPGGGGGGGGGGGVI